MMKKIFFIVMLVLLLHIPYTSQTSTVAKNAEQKKVTDKATPEKSNHFPDREDDIFSSTYERELLARKIFKKSLPPLSRKEKIIWSFKTAKANTFL
jgi:hypothetical protein